MGLRPPWLRRVPRQKHSERSEDASHEKGRLVARGVDEPPGGDGCDERPRQPDAREEGDGRRGDGWLNQLTDVREDEMWNEDFSGQMSMLDDVRETMGAALKYLGYSLNTTEESEVEEAKELLMEQKDLLSTYDSSDFPTNLINEQLSPVHAWSGGAFQAYWETFEDGSSPVNYVIPEEGGVVWVDTAAITTEAENVNAAHAFINHFLDAEVGAEITNYTYYGSPNEAAEEYILDEILNNESIYPDDETMSNLEYIENIGQATTLYSNAWQEIKSA